MFDIRPAAYVIGLLVMVLGCTMVMPMAMDLYDGNGQWWVFGLSGALTSLSGGMVALACANSAKSGLTIQQTFLLTTGVWLVLPIFGSLPFYFGATEASIVDGFFEAMSGLTTTGSTVFSGLSELPRGILLWRGLLQWFGGVGIIVVAMVFLPTLRVGGMQVFRTEAFETMGKILPKAAEIAKQISLIYFVLTALCFGAYLAAGMSVFDAVVHALTTLSTGGFSTSDASFGDHQGLAEYVASVFMILAALPFVRYVQLVAGSAKPMWRDSQIRAFLLVLGVFVALLAVYQLLHNHDDVERSIREGLFNAASIITGTGFASVDYQAWGSFPMMLFFLMGLVGGCAGSTSCSIKIFRYQLLISAVNQQINQLHNPNGVFILKYDGRPVTADVMSSVMAFFMLFMLSLAVLSVALGMTGLDTVTAISGAATALANVGPGLGPIIGPSGYFGELNDTSKWLLSGGMLIGRLELMAVFVLFTVNFWRN
jgi:trk system potassium uptake protein TrkH